ncbi:hypothetical protein ACHAWF_012752 [Thalassiosira exigua]
MMDDVSKGYVVIVTMDCLKRLKDAKVYPMGILGNKVDIDEAYRCLHASPRVAAKCSSTWFLYKINDLGKILSKSAKK